MGKKCKNCAFWNYKDTYKTEDGDVRVGKCSGIYDFVKKWEAERHIIEECNSNSDSCSAAMCTDAQDYFTFLTTEDFGCEFHDEKE